MEKENNVSIERVRNILECSICQLALSSTPIFQCENGHIVCKICREKKTKCSVCLVELRDERSKKAEVLLYEHRDQRASDKTFADTTKNVSILKTNTNSNSFHYLSKLNFYDI